MLKFGMKNQKEGAAKHPDLEPLEGEATQSPTSEVNAPDSAATPEGAMPCDWWTPDMDQAFDAAAAEAALTPEQLVTLKAIFVESICEAEVDQQAATQANRADVLKQIEALWGGDSDRKLAAASQAASALKLDAQALDTLIAHPNAIDILAALAELGEAMAEDGALPVSGDQARAGEARAIDDLVRLKSDKDHVAAYLNPSHPGHAAAKRQRRALIDQSLGRS